jgi:PAS domain S-box-containing protein
VIATDVGGSIVLANRAAQLLLRRAESEVVGKHLNDVFQVVDEFSREKIDRLLTRVLREGAIIGPSNHTILLAEDGTEAPIDDSGAPIRGKTGLVQGIVLVFRDVSARRRADETARLLASIVQSSDDAIIGHDLAGAITSWNKGAERIFGYSAQEMIGQSTAALAPPAEDEMPKVLERVRNGERVEQYYAVRRTKAGRDINVSITVSPLHDGVGRIVGASKIARDVTQQVHAAEQLARLNADLRRSNENLSRSNEDLERFAFIASHDFQEPLRMISIYSQLLIKSYAGQMDTKASAYVDNIVNGTQRLRDLLADLLAYTEVGVAKEESTRIVDLNSVVQKVEANLAAAIDESGAVLIAPTLPSVRAHEGHFIALFQNLVGNAIKYRGQEIPRIEISARSVGDHFLFAVADNGMGIEPEYHEKIFVAFKRLHGKQIPGTGIGLAICQRVVERYGGRIWVESQIGRGATFLFTLPIQICVPNESYE